MYKVKLLNNIKSKKLEIFSKEKYEVGVETEDHSALMLRSAKIHDMVFGEELLCIARAGAGYNNIPVDRCAEEGIVVFNTPGANAGAVKELVICGLFLSSRDIVSGIEWVKTVVSEGDAIPALVEKQKAQYVGPEVAGKSLGVVGLGAIGAKIAEAALGLGMKVYGYDPYISVESAWHLSSKIRKADDLDTIYSKCDFISINIPFIKGVTEHTINKESIAKMKKGVRIINAARAELVNDDDMLEALESGQVSCYVTDFPNAKTAGAKGVIAIPHLGASTPESEDNCVSMAADQIVEYIENGNIINSVNLPGAFLPRIEGDPRLCIIHNNVPEMIATITGTISKFGVNIENMLNAGAKGKLASYTLVDVDKIADGLEEAISQIDGVTRVRVLG
ncbi:MAG: 3-phosphoglycerate dehydrogenase family protein [Oscillospiraceae bacterium]|nr:3-phosphoglycerate dehydrogenase family protein [Oscillospiraceae bacterium]